MGEDMEDEAAQRRLKTRRVLVLASVLVNLAAFYQKTCEVPFLERGDCQQSCGQLVATLTHVGCVRKLLSSQEV